MRPATTCKTCQGKKTVTIKDANGTEKQVVCPECKGLGKSGGYLIK